MSIIHINAMDQPITCLKLSTIPSISRISMRRYYSIILIILESNCCCHQLNDYIDVIYRIHEDDVPIMKGKQWYTRMLYNAYPPFRLNFVIDTHVYPCDRDSTIQLFSQFDKSQVDLSVGNRVNKRVLEFCFDPIQRQKPSGLKYIKQ